MEFKNTIVSNFEGAFRGMRGPLKSWDRSDSFFGLICLECDFPDADFVVDSWIDHENMVRADANSTILDIDKNADEYYEVMDKYCRWMRDVGTLRSDGFYSDVAFLGYNDLKLAQSLVKAGPEHSKFMRQIQVSVDITAPIYWWKEFDTYKIGTTANSTSTMHTLKNERITWDKFEMDDFNGDLDLIDDVEVYLRADMLLDFLEQLRQRYLITGDKKYWKELVRWLPQGWLQTRTVTLNYAILRNIYFQRKGHKLSEWHSFIDWLKTLPYSEELITLE